MRIAIIGAGNVGGALGRGWARAGHEVVYSARDASTAKAAEMRKRLGPDARVASVPEAAAAGDVVLLATPWGAAEAAIREAGSLEGKTLLDATNPLKRDLSGLELGHTTSAGEQVAAWARGASVVKIFNTTGADNIANPNYEGTRVTMFYCGDSAPAKATAQRLAADLGFDPIDAGPLRQARLLEPLALLWISLAYAQGLGRDIAFHLMKR